MVNGISVKHKLKIVDFPCVTSEKILQKLDVIIKEQPDNLIVHVGTNDLTNNVNLLAKKKSSIKFLKNRGRHPSCFHLPSTAKTRPTSRKPNAHFKILNKKGNIVFAKNFLHYINRRAWSFIPYDLVTVNACLSDTLEKAKSDAYSSLQTTGKDNLNKLIFANLKINSISSISSTL